MLNVQVQISERLAHGRDSEQLKKAMGEGLVLHDYLTAEISLGEMAELLDLSYEETLDWLSSQGIPTLRRFRDSELEKACERSFDRLANELGTKMVGQ